MWKTIARRLLILVPQLFALSLLIFLLAQLMPGDALRGFIGPGTHPDLLERLREHHGLNDPWYQQYWRWLTAVLQGDMGNSITFQRPVIAVIGDRIGNTMLLSIMASLFTYLIAVPLGILAARHKGTSLDRGTMIYTFVALSIPTVVMGLINILVFALTLGWFPPFGAVELSAHAAGGWTAFSSRIYHALLPAFTMAFLGTVSIIYYLRNEIIDNDSSDFVTTARSKGVPENEVYTRHILRNALLPVAGSAGALVVLIFSGSIFIETVFTFQGMGQLFISSIRGRDFPVANALIMFYAILNTLAILVTDIVITIIDPRIRIK
ncbi:MAG: ABC transporter permease [Oscillospiraceae bacterium]|nr:ABC transporter permease [Oscillospiraceae bacterium]